MPHRDSVPLTWRLQKHKYNIIGKKCHCGEVYFPPRLVCTTCHAEMKDDMIFSGQGEIVSYTVIHTGPEKFEGHTPYVIALVKLKEGPTISAPVVTRASEVTIGKQVQIVFRRTMEPDEDAHIKYGFKFEVIE